YEDSSGSLYLHKEGENTVYAHIEPTVNYGASFEQDASEIARGVKGDGTAETIPFAELNLGGDEPGVRRIAVWEDGKVIRTAQPGADGEAYLTTNARMHTKMP